MKVIERFRSSPGLGSITIKVMNTPNGCENLYLCEGKFCMNKRAIRGGEGARIRPSHPKNALAQDCVGEFSAKGANSSG